MQSSLEDGATKKSRLINVNFEVDICQFVIEPCQNNLLANDITVINPTSRWFLHKSSQSMQVFTNFEKKMLSLHPKFLKYHFNKLKKYRMKRGLFYMGRVTSDFNLKLKN